MSPLGDGQGRAVSAISDQVDANGMRWTGVDATTASNAVFGGKCPRLDLAIDLSCTQNVISRTFGNAVHASRAVVFGNPDTRTVLVEARRRSVCSHSGLPSKPVDGAGEMRHPP